MSRLLCHSKNLCRGYFCVSLPPPSVANQRQSTNTMTKSSQPLLDLIRPRQSLCFASQCSSRSFSSLGRGYQPSLPRRYFDPHHHFFDMEATGFHTFMEGVLGKRTKYLPEDYYEEVRAPTETAGVEWRGSVHVEFLPDDGRAEVAWVQSLVDADRCDVKAIVGGCDLAADDVERELSDLRAASPLVRGVRWVVNRPNSVRIDGRTDLLNDGPLGGPVDSFEKGYAALAKYDMSFDLNCDLEQLPGAYILASRCPEVRLCIDHRGRPKFSNGTINGNSAQRDESIAEWRANMKSMAELPHVAVKISNHGLSIPDWIEDPCKESIVRDLSLEIVDIFGPQRCMVATNWWLDARMSDSDGLDSVGPTQVQLLGRTSDWFQNYSAEERDFLFWKTAERFYRIHE